MKSESICPVLVIVPVYGESANLETLLQGIAWASPGSHILFINDESGDGSPLWIKAQPGFGERIFLIERSKKSGLGTAYVE
jgi:dolichol-phosphate mannosyltransferase